MQVTWSLFPLNKTLRQTFLLLSTRCPQWKSASWSSQNGATQLQYQPLRYNSHKNMLPYQKTIKTLPPGLNWTNQELIRDHFHNSPSKAVYSFVNYSDYSVIVSCKIIAPMQRECLLLEQKVSLKCEISDVLLLFASLKQKLKIHPVASASAQQQQYLATSVTAWTRPEKQELQRKGGGAGRKRRWRKRKALGIQGNRW